MSGVTITEFLLAQIAEDEADAQDAYYDGQRWLSEEEAVVAADRDMEPVMFLDRKRDARHAVNWSPARVLAECEAKRRIVELHPRMDYDKPYRGTPCCERCTADGEYPADDGGTDEQNWPCPTLRALALPYADHPAFQPEWAV